MQYRRFAVRAAAALVASSALSMSWAATDTGQGRFFGATVSTDGGWSLSFTESLTDKTASLVISFWAGSTPAVDEWSRSIVLRDLSLTGPQYTGTNSNGDSVYAEIDLSHWTFTATGLLSAPPADALFKTAYGSETLSNTLAPAGSGVVTVDSHPTFSGISIASTYPQDAPPLVWGEATTLPGIWFRLRHAGITPYYAKPSTTNPRCQSLSCLDYEAGLYTPQSYVLTFALAETVVPTSAVPEPATWLMALAGLSALAVTRRRA